MLDKLHIKNLYKIIGSVILAILILLSVMFLMGKSDKKHNKSKVSGKVDSSMVDESSQTDSIVDSKTDSSSVLDKGKPTATVTTKAPSVKPTTPENVSMKFVVVSFQSANTTTKYNFPVPLFERIYGKTKNINGSIGKYVQQGDIVKIKISSGSSSPKIEPIGNVSVISFQDGIATIKILDTAKKNVYNNVERLPANRRDTIEKISLLTNDDYVYKVDPNINHGIKVGNISFMFGVFDKFNWSEKDVDAYQTIVSMYLAEKGLSKFTSKYGTLTYGYTNGDVNNSFMKCIYIADSHLEADDIIQNDKNLYTNVFSTIDFYKKNGYEIYKMIKTSAPISEENYSLKYVGFVAK